MMNFISVLNDQPPFNIKLVLIFIKYVCDISPISKDSYVNIGMGRSARNN